MFEKRAHYIVSTMKPNLLKKIRQKIESNETLVPHTSKSFHLFALLKKYFEQLEKISSKFGLTSEQFDVKSDEMLIDVLKTLSQADPTKNFQYLQWIICRWCDGDFLIEDLSRIRSELESFEQYKPRLKRDGHSTDINTYKASGSVFEILQQYREDDVAFSQKEEERRYEKHLFDSNKAILILADEQTKVIKLNSYDAAKHFGKGTRWCTTSSTSMFEMYNKQGPLFVVLTDKSKFQFHFESDQFRDAVDRRIEFRPFIIKHPILKSVFQPQAREFLIVWLLEEVTAADWTNAFNKLKSIQPNRRFTSFGGYNDVFALLRDMPPQYQTLDMALFIAKISSKSALHLVRDDLQQMPAFQTIIVTKQPQLLIGMDPEYQTFELAKSVLAQHPLMLRYIREDLMVPELLHFALQKAPEALGQIPPRKQTKTIVNFALKQTKNTRILRSLINMVKDKKYKEQLTLALRQSLQPNTNV